MAKKPIVEKHIRINQRPYDTGRWGYRVCSPSGHASQWGSFTINKDDLGIKMLRLTIDITGAKITHYPAEVAEVKEFLEDNGLI